MKAAILLSFVVLAIGSGGLLSYVWIAVRLARGEKLVEWTPRRYVPWGLVDLIWPVFLLLFFGAALLVVLGRDDQLILLDAAMKFSAMTVAIPLILLRTRGAASDMGVSFQYAQRDLLIGVVALVSLLPVVFLMQAILIQFWPYEHPLIDKLKETPDLTYFWISTFSAVIVAPLSEEWFFRVLLQGWLEKVFSYRGPKADLILGGVTAISEIAPLEAMEPLPTIVVSGDASPTPDGLEELNPYAAPLLGPVIARLKATTADNALQTPWPTTYIGQWAPILISSLVFSLLHYGQGAAWVPLTFLAIGMGYIYQRTHSILPSLVVHVGLNSFSMLALWVQMYEMESIH